MATIPNKRAIINRQVVAGRLDELAQEMASGAPGAELRRAVLEHLKTVLDQGKSEVRRRFDDGADGPTTARALAFLIDQLVTVILDFTTSRIYRESNPTAADRLALVAVGGYGRGELAPQSDVDILFLVPYKQTPRGEQIVEYILYLMWDLGLKVGQSTRSVDETIVRARKDFTIRTSVLEARFIYGDQDLYVELRQRFAKDVVADSGSEFIAAKLTERDDRHQRLGDSRYVVEPNIKDGKGGMRDLHTLFWIAKYVYRVEHSTDLVARGVLTAEEFRMFEHAHRFLWTVRFHLHYLTNRPEERLTFDVQPEIATAMGYTDHAGTQNVERFMKHYYLIAKTVGDLTRIFCAALEAEHGRKPLLRVPTFGYLGRNIEGFRLDHGRLSVKSDDDFERDPVAMLRLFHVAQARGIDVHPHALMLITRTLKRVDAKMRANPEANRLFVEMLLSDKEPEITLKRMNEAGVLGKFIPAFGRVVAQTQHDMYHVYTVDEHTIFSIGLLSRIESGDLEEELPLATEIVHEILSRKVLLLALFLHDIGKGRGGDHSEIGARIARKLAPRLGYTVEETETVAWLVEHHLLCSTTAFNRDISDPKTIDDFVEIVQSPQRLRLLLVLTVADIRAVGPNVWNGWKGQLLRGLYYRAEAVMTGGDTLSDLEERVEQAQAALRAELGDWPDTKIDAFIARNYAPYWLNFNTEVHARHARLMRKGDESDNALTVETKIHTFRSVTEVTVYAPDHPGLFSGIAGALAVCGASIVDARIFTTKDGMVVDTFWVQSANGGPFDQPRRLAKLATTIDETLARDYKPALELERREDEAMASRKDIFKVAPRVLIDNRASATHTVIEVNAKDRPGLLFDATRKLGELGLTIGSSRINTYGETAIDVFYVKDVFGMKISDESRLAAIKADLLEALVEGDRDARRPKVAAE
jgi:[protein-PII] uridylyltransferase